MSTTNPAVDILTEMSAVEVLKRLLVYMRDGTLIRNTEHDDEPGWTLEQLRFVMVLKAADMIVANGDNAVAVERAACAQVARDMCDRYWSIDKNTLIDAAHAVCGNIADAIERRGEVPQPDTAGQRRARTNRQAQGGGTRP